MSVLPLPLWIMTVRLLPWPFSATVKQGPSLQHLCSHRIRPVSSRKSMCLQDAYRGAEVRMHQEALRRHVLRLLRIWRDWFIFADDFLNGLQVRTWRQLHTAMADVALVHPSGCSHANEHTVPIWNLCSSCTVSCC